MGGAGLEEGYLQVGEHAQQAPQQAAVDGLAAAFPLDEQQDAVDGLALDLQVADDVEPEELQAHVPETHSRVRRCLRRRSATLQREPRGVNKDSPD